MKIAAIAHIYYLDLVDEFVHYLKNLPDNADIYISTIPGAKYDLEELFSKKFGKARVQVREVENRGMDIAPFLVFYRDICLKYDLICKIHTKKGNHSGFLEGWRLYLLENLLGSKKNIDQIIFEFQNDKKLGVIFPEHFPFIRAWIDWGGDFNAAYDMAQKMRIPISRDEVEFPSGSMFWAKSEALLLFNNLNLRSADFDYPLGEHETDGRLEHAIERIFLNVVKSGGFHWKKILFQPLLKSDYSSDTPSELLQEHIRITNQNVSELSKALRSHATRIRLAETKLRSTETRLHILQNKLTSIHNSILWKTASTIYGCIDMVCPCGTRRAKLYLILSKAIKRMFLAKNPKRILRTKK